MGRKLFECCHGCTKRYPHCHSHCGDYINDRKELDDENDRIHEIKKQVTSDLIYKERKHNRLKYWKKERK